MTSIIQCLTLYNHSIYTQELYHTYTTDPLCKRGCNTIVCATAYTSFIRLVYTISVYFRCASLYTKCILVFSTCLSTWWYISVFPRMLYTFCIHDAAHAILIIIIIIDTLHPKLYNVYMYVCVRV